MSTMEAATLVSPERLQELLTETELELEQLQPCIEEMEKQVQELRKLKQTKQRLITLKMSLSTLLESITRDEVKDKEDSTVTENLETSESAILNFSELSTLKTFHPEEAFRQADRMLKQRNSLNYEMFKAVVFNGGKATTEEIKAYLVESNATQPQTGEGFGKVPLTEISSRVNYLVRKGVLHSADRGAFYSALGWVNPS